MLIIADDCNNILAEVETEIDDEINSKIGVNDIVDEFWRCYLVLLDIKIVLINRVILIILLKIVKVDIENRGLNRRDNIDFHYKIDADFNEREGVYRL